jgi:two-component system sensor histidine kinase QseC
MIHRRPFSLSQRLLLVLGTVSFLYWSVIATLTTQDNITEVNELYDAHLARTAKAFLQFMDPDDNEAGALPATLPSDAIEQLFDQWPDLPGRPAVGKQPFKNQHPQENSAALAEWQPLASKRAQYGKALRYQLWRDDGSLMFRSDNAPATVMTERAGLSDSTDREGKLWRHYRVHDKGHGVHVIVSEPHDLRDKLVRSIVMSAAAPLAFGLPVLFFLLWFSIRKGLHPLALLSLEIAKRRADNLTLLDEQGVPVEVKPIVLALNSLLQRMAKTLDNERRFTDDAAHELRTPLATIQAQLYAVRKTQDEVERQHAMDQLQRGIERGIRLVNQMLMLARLDSRQPQNNFQKINLGEIAEMVCAELAPMALQQNQTLELSVEPELPCLMGSADMLAILVRNLVDNAIRYAGNGGCISVVIRPDGSGVLLEVRDDGPGIGPSQRERVFERFYRMVDQKQPGTGLGLTICQQIAELHHAKISLSDGPQHRGLTASVQFPA